MKHDFTVVSGLFDILAPSVSGSLKTRTYKGHHDDNIEFLRNIFVKIGLPSPRIEQITNTSEEGYQLFLNEFGCTIRTYPSKGYTPSPPQQSRKNRKKQPRRKFRKTLPKTKEQLKRKRNRMTVTSAIYHPDSIPPIGTLRFPKFTLQIFPGVHNRNIPYDQIAPIVQNIENDIGTIDSHADNWGHTTEQHQKVIFLDTIERVRLSKYHGYYKNGTLNSMIEAHKRFLPLQKEFLSAWETNDFSKFWRLMKDSKEQGLLVDGWNQATDHRFRASKEKFCGSPPQTAARYETAHPNIAR